MRGTDGCFSCGKKAKKTCAACHLSVCNACIHWKDCELRLNWSENLVFPLSVHVRSALIEFQRRQNLESRQQGVTLARKEWAKGCSVYLWTYSDQAGLVLEFELVHPADLKRKHYLTFCGFAIALLHVKKKHQEDVEDGRNEFGTLPIHRAAFHNTLQENVDDVADGFGRTIAHWSAMGGKWDREKSVAAKSDALWALPVHYWVWAGHLQSSNKFALKAARDAMGKSLQNGSSLVHLAVLGGASKEEILQLVGDNKKLLNVSDSSRMLPLHTAIRMWNLDLTHFFLGVLDTKHLPVFETDPLGGSLEVDRAVSHLREGKVAVFGVSFFTFACYHGSLDVIDIVMKVVSESDRLVTFLLVCALGKIRVAKFLMDRGDLSRNCSSIMTRDMKGNVPSRSKLVAWACTIMPCLDLIKLLIQTDFLDVKDLRMCLSTIVKNVRDDVKFFGIVSLLLPLEFDVEALHGAAARNDFGFLKTLLGKNEKECIHPDTKRSLLHSACVAGSDSVVKWLMSDTNVRERSPLTEDSSGKTLFHDACLNCSVETVQALLRNYGSSILSCRTVDGDTPLIFLSRVANWQDSEWRHLLGRRVEVAKLLIENGARVEAQNKWGNTALHYAVYPCHQAALGIVFLKESPRSLLGIANRIGITALQLSQEAREKDPVLVKALIALTGLTSSSWARSASARDIDQRITPYF